MIAGNHFSFYSVLVHMNMPMMRVAGSRGQKRDDCLLPFVRNELHSLAGGQFLRQASNRFLVLSELIHLLRRLQYALNDSLRLAARQRSSSTR